MLTKPPVAPVAVNVPDEKTRPAAPARATTVPPLPAVLLALVSAVVVWVMFCAPASVTAPPPPVVPFAVTLPAWVMPIAARSIPPPVAPSAARRPPR